MSVFDDLSLVRQVKSPDGKIQTRQFLDVCRSILPVVEKLGTAFALVKSDVGGNIDRLATRTATNPAAYEPDVFQIVRDEVAAGTQGGSSSCTKGLLWLKRAMQFIVALLSKLQQDPSITMSAAVTEAYAATLQQYHGWIVSSTFTVAFKLAPTRETFFEKLGASSPQDERVLAGMAAFCSEFGALLAEVHAFLADNDLDDPAKV